MAEQTGELVAIAFREASRAPMQMRESTEITLEAGVVGDFRGKPGRRQVTVLTIEGWSKACEVVGEELPWTNRRANLLIKGCDLKHTIGDLIQIGDVKLRITGETEPCERMNEAKAGLFAALEPDWRSGVCCQVEAGGEIQLGDEIKVSKQIEV